MKINMKIKKYLILAGIVVAAVLLMSINVFSQAVQPKNKLDKLDEVRFLVGGQLGLVSGYDIPTLQGNIGVEIPLSRHFEIQTRFSSGWTPKTDSHSGYSFHQEARGIYWFSDKLGINGEFRQTYLYTKLYDKHAWAPTAGLAWRNGWTGKDGMPGRMYLNWIFPTGCQWATASNPCRIQSSRLTGMEVNQEFRIGHHIRLGLIFGILRGLEQGNPNQPSAGRISYPAVDYEGVVRYEFGKSSNEVLW